MDLNQFRVGLDQWLDEHEAQLAPTHDADVTFDGEMAHLATVKRLTYDAGWMRWGWPERVGGLGGSTLMRAYLGEALACRDLIEPSIYSMTEVLLPTVIEFAPGDLAEQVIPRFLRGDEVWCQGFSEPGAGSDLAALSCRASRKSDAWLVTGQKVWTSLAQYADRCILMVRSGSPEAAGRGITALFVDMATPGITVRPIRAMHGRDEFCEVFFDDVVVPIERTFQALFDLAESAFSAEVATGSDSRSARWRREFLYSRAATIYGGSAEVQRNIISRRLLDLGAEQ